MTAVTAALCEHVVIAGGSSGMGLAIASAMLADGAKVTIVGRSAERLAAAQHHLGQADRLRTVGADIGSEQDVVGLFETVGSIDHIVTTAADIRGGYELIGSLDMSLARQVLDSKLIGPMLLAKYGAPLIVAGGSITFTSGIAAYRPGPKGCVVAAANGALASLARALAVELAPIRVNAISPGWVDTPIWDSIAGHEKGATLAAMAERLPVGRVGTPRDIADAALTLMHNGYITGTVLHVDGGQRLI